MRNNKICNYIGVTLNRESGSYVSRIRINGKTKALGSFKTQIEAAKAYDGEALKCHNEFIRLNFPEPEPENLIPNTKLIRLTQGLFATVDSNNFERANKFKWHAEEGDNTYYATRTIRINGKRSSISLHRFILKTGQTY